MAQYGAFDVAVSNAAPAGHGPRPGPICQCKKEALHEFDHQRHHLEITPALRSYVSTKLDRVIRHFDQVVDVRVLLTVENQKEKDKRQRAECRIGVKGNDLFAESSHEDLYAAVDELVDKLDRQVAKYKEKQQSHDKNTAVKHLM